LNGGSNGNQSGQNGTELTENTSAAAPRTEATVPENEETTMTEINIKLEVTEAISTESNAKLEQVYKHETTKLIDETVEPTLKTSEPISSQKLETTSLGITEITGPASLERGLV
jgi:hypothetical protein